jgi:hypothetical protein
MVDIRNQNLLRECMPRHSCPPHTLKHTACHTKMVQGLMVHDVSTQTRIENARLVCRASEAHTSATVARWHTCSHQCRSCRTGQSRTRQRAHGTLLPSLLWPRIALCNTTRPCTWWGMQSCNRSSFSQRGEKWYELGQASTIETKIPNEAEGTRSRARCVDVVEVQAWPRVALCCVRDVVAGQHLLRCE